jgi:adenylyl-sulfate kinase
MAPPATPAAATVWLTGLPAAGKSTLATAIVDALRSATVPAALLDGDELRANVNAGLGYGVAARAESVRRAGGLALELARSGVVAVVAMVSPFTADRRAVRELHRSHGVGFVEVWVATPLPVCEQRDPKGLYRRARAGELHQMTGIDQCYEPPEAPELTIDTSGREAGSGAELVVAHTLSVIGSVVMAPGRPA